MKTRASARKGGFRYPAQAEYRLQHNIANDLIRIVRWASQAAEEDFDRVFAAYTRPLITLVFACSAIEGYTNYVGQRLSGDWLSFSKGMLAKQKGRPGIKDKIKRIYQYLGKDAPFDSGLFQNVIILFETRGYLMHPSLDDRAFTGAAPPADILEMIGEDYAPAKVASLAEEFTERLLSDSGIADVACQLSYKGKSKRKKDNL